MKDDLRYLVLKGLNEGKDKHDIGDLFREQNMESEINASMYELYTQGLINGLTIIGAGQGDLPSILWNKMVTLTRQGINWLNQYEKEHRMRLDEAILSACEKISTHPTDYRDCSENMINRHIVDMLSLSLSGQFVFLDQTQHGSSQSGKQPGEIDILVRDFQGKEVAIIEGLIHQSEEYLIKHIEKATGSYNSNGCRNIIVLDYAIGRDFEVMYRNDRTWLCNHDYDVSYHETGVNSVKRIDSSFSWNSETGKMQVYVVFIDKRNS